MALTCICSWSQCEVADTGSDLQTLSKVRHYASWAKHPFLGRVLSRRMWLPLKRDVPKSPFGTNEQY